MTKFQVGDVVRLRSSTDFLAETKGMLAIVQEIEYSDTYPIKLSFADGTYLACRISELELIKSV